MPNKDDDKGRSSSGSSIGSKGGGSKSGGGSRGGSKSSGGGSKGSSGNR